MSLHTLVCYNIRAMNDIVPYQRELSERQAAFVKAFVATGDAHQSALTAGYAEATARNAGSQLLDSDNVTMAIVQASRQRLARGAPVALNTLEVLMTKAQSERVRLEASKAWLDRAGLVSLKPPDESREFEKPIHELSINELRALVAYAEANLEKGEAELASRAKPVDARVSDPIADLTELS